MSYDLFFSPRSGSELPREAFAAYFGGRPNYEVGDTQAWYSNEETGVYFSFDHASVEEAQDEDTPGSVASFNMNYFRPPFFALEAEPEVASFVREFDLIVHDPQIDGIGEGDYSKEGFLSGWNTGNAFGHHGILSEQGNAKIFSVPERQLIASWEWNYRRAGLQQGLGEDAFVPRIMFFDVDGVTLSAVAWGDGIPILLPQVDAVVVVRQELAPRRFFFRKQDVVVVRWADLLPIVGDFPVADHPLHHIRLLYERPPEPIHRFLTELSPTHSALQALPFDQVLSAELVSAARDVGPPEAITFDPTAGE